MWPFKRSSRNRDLLLEEVDLSVFAPFAEAERYILVFPVGVGQNYVLVVVYEAGTGERVHVAHSPGYQRGGGMENFVEWVATGVRRRDPRAIALLTSWPTDATAARFDELVRSSFAPREGGRASPGTTVLVGEQGEVQNVLTRDHECWYADPSFYPRLPRREWSRILGTEVLRFSTTEWEEAADAVDPDRAIRDQADRETDDQFAVHDAFLKEMGVWGDE